LEKHRIIGIYFKKTAFKAVNIFKEFSMKKAFKLVGIITFTVIIAFTMTACDNSGGGGGNNNGTTGGDGNGNGNTTISGENLRLTGQPVELNGCTTTNFSYQYVGNGQVQPLSTYITGEPRVEISNGKLNISLDTPKNGEMESFNDIFDGPDITISPNNTRCFGIEEFYTSDGLYYLYLYKNDNSYTALIYVDKDVTVNGQYIDDKFTTKWNNVTLKKGWNYYVVSKNGNTITCTATRALPSGFKWVGE
jgi:hypothetical protein